MSGVPNFDQHLRMKLGKEQYLANKRKAGASGSSKGTPRPYSKANALKARLWSPLFVGTSLTVTPKHPFKKFGRGVYYEWEITAPGFGIIESTEVSAQEIFDHFIVKPKGLK